MDSYRILFCGDVVGRPGRQMLREGLPSLVETHEPLFVIANGENSAAGVGITPDTADELFSLGVDAITLGNHAFHKREIYEYLNTDRAIVRPMNMPPSNPGRGLCTIERGGVRLAVMNLCGRVFMDSYDDPFREIDRVLEMVETSHRLIDFHGEATSEKIAFAQYCDGRATAVLGTHTHVQTADERILPEGTATISDVGMTGPSQGVLGMDSEAVIRRFRTSMPHRFEVAGGPSVICGVVIDVEKESGRAIGIRRFQFGEGARSVEA